MVSGVGMNGRQLLALLKRPMPDRAAQNDNLPRSVEDQPGLLDGVCQPTDRPAQKRNRRARRHR